MRGSAACPFSRAHLPLTKLGLMFTLTLTFLGVLYLLGEQGVRLGSLLVPRVDPLLSLVIFVLCVALTTTRAPVRVIGLLVTLGVLTGVAVLLRAWHPMLSDPPSPFIGSVSELDESTALNKRTVMLPLLQVRSGRHLRQLVGRRQNVAVDTSGYMRVDQTGLHRLRLRCDDHCILRVNGETVADVSGFGSIEVYLDEGVYPFSLRYEQGVGPAVMTLDWNRPALVELLPLEAYMGGRAESLTSHRLNRKRLGTILWLTLAGLWCALASITLVRAGASGRALLQRLYSLIEWRRLAESLTLLWVSPRLRTLLVFSFDLLLYVVVYRRRQLVIAGNSKRGYSVVPSPRLLPSARRSSEPCTVSGIVDKSTRPRCGPRFWTREPTSATIRTRCIGFRRIALIGVRERRNANYVTLFSSPSPDPCLGLFRVRLQVWYFDHYAATSTAYC